MPLCNDSSIATLKHTGIQVLVIDGFIKVFSPLNTLYTDTLRIKLLSIVLYFEI